MNEPRSTTPPESGTPASSDELQQRTLQEGMESLCGHSTFAILEDVCNAARRFGFAGTLADAQRLLAALPGIEVESAADPANSRVSKSDFPPFRSFGG